MKSIKGKFIVFEGIDGAGTETQSKLLFRELKRRGIEAIRLSYPDKNGAIGRVIYEYLAGKHILSVETQFLLYLCDFMKDQGKIKNWLREGKVVISDRYFTSTLAYQVAKGFSLDKAIALYKIFGIIKPDFTIFLKISSETSMHRKLKEKKNLDKHESNKQLLNKTIKCYEDLVKNNIFTTWKVIDGEKPITEIFTNIKDTLKL